MLLTFKTISGVEALQPAFDGLYKNAVIPLRSADAHSPEKIVDLQ